MISVKGDFDRFERLLTDLRVTHLPFAAARALTDAATLARTEVAQQLPTVFDRPTRFTLNALGVQGATKQTLASAVYVKPIQAGYLYLEEFGGVRAPKATALVLPGVGQKLNAYGNIPKGRLAKLRQQAQVKGSSVAYCAGAGARGRGPGGYFKRVPKGLKRLIAFEPSATYHPRWGFHASVAATARRTFSLALKRRLREAIA